MTSHWNKNKLYKWGIILYFVLPIKSGSLLRPLYVSPISPVSPVGNVLLVVLNSYQIKLTDSCIYQYHLLLIKIVLDHIKLEAWEQSLNMMNTPTREPPGTGVMENMSCTSHYLHFTKGSCVTKQYCLDDTNVHQPTRLTNRPMTLVYPPPTSNVIRYNYWIKNSSTVW